MSNNANANANNNQQEEEENVVYTDSFFIPHVFSYFSLESLVNLIENNGENSIGKVERIESIPKTNPHTGHSYYSCFVILEKWADTQFAYDLERRLYNDEQTRLYFDPNAGGKYIVLLPNKSETSFLEAPEHMDLMLYLHTDVRLETVFNVMEGLDIGKINSIESYLYFPPPHAENNNDNPSLWKHANTDMWNNKVKPTYNVVYVRFDYWYKTQTAYNFKKEFKTVTYAEIPVFEGVQWIFYETQPRFNGVNPYVWQRMNV
jgi:hypothetical protein